MRRVRFNVAMSLDGYIAGPNGEFDWIVMDEDIDFEKLTSSFDTVLLGRKTYEANGLQGGDGQTVVISRTLRAEDCPGARVSSDLEGTLAQLKKQPGKDIWLFGGGELFRSMLDLGLVDTVEISIIPVLLGGGLPLLPPPATQARLKFTGQRIYPKSGIVTLEYVPA